jgi:hypothetical protein
MVAVTAGMVDVEPVQFRWDMQPLPYKGIEKENVALGPSFGVAICAPIDVERAVN